MIPNKQVFMFHILEWDVPLGHIENRKSQPWNKKK